MAFPDLAPLLKNMMPELRGRALPNQPLAELTWFRVGGPAQLLFIPEDEADLALMPVAEASLKLILQWTVPRISETLGLRTRAIAERARGEFGIASVPAHRRAGHYLGLRFRGGVPPDLPKRLAAANVYVSVRGQAMRVTPHVWNTDDDVEKLFAVLKAELS